MHRFLLGMLIVGGSLFSVGNVIGREPIETVRQADQVLAELMAIPGKSIPQRLLSEAQGVAIIPSVIKIGFVAGARRGHGVVMVRDAEGEWNLPEFITLTGGSIGWQAGVQGTDVVLVFMTRKSIEGLMAGKFTIGADASATAGPVGRNAAAATDSALKAEILSYSRSRGLFLGVSIDGSAIEIDQDAHTTFYGAPMHEIPTRVPDSSATLRQYLTQLTGGGAAAAAGLGDQAIAPEFAAARLDALRRGLTQNAGQLQTILSPEWKQYLALPREVYDPTLPPNMEALAASQQRYGQVAASPNYQSLNQRPEFLATHELLREYVAVASSTKSALQLPPPPVPVPGR